MVRITAIAPAACRTFASIREARAWAFAYVTADPTAVLRLAYPNGVQEVRYNGCAAFATIVSYFGE